MNREQIEREAYEKIIVELERSGQTRYTRLREKFLPTPKPERVERTYQTWFHTESKLLDVFSGGYDPSMDDPRWEKLGEPVKMFFPPLSREEMIEKILAVFHGKGIRWDMGEQRFIQLNRLEDVAQLILDAIGTPPVITWRPRSEAKDDGKMKVWRMWTVYGYIHTFSIPAPPASEYAEFFEVPE